MQELNCETPRDLARQVWPGNFDAPKRVQRWLDGENEPNYEAMVAMIRCVIRARAQRAGDAHEAEHAARLLAEFFSGEQDRESESR